MIEVPPLPWKCPACGAELLHHDRLPKPAARYHCLVCRSELMFDVETQKMRLAPAWRPNVPNDPREQGRK